MRGLLSSDCKQPRLASNWPEFNSKVLNWTTPSWTEFLQYLLLRNNGVAISHQLHIYHI